jgi:hypothetical protein
MKLTRFFVLWTAPLALVTVAGCSPKDQPIIPLDEVCATAENGTTVTTAGFLTGPDGLMMCDGTTCEMAISNRGIGGNTNLRIDVRLGSGRNAMVEPPDRYTNADLVVKDNEGVARELGDWIVVQGRILTGSACLITPASFILPGEAPQSATGSAATTSPAANGSGAPAATGEGAKPGPGAPPTSAKP